MGYCNFIKGISNYKVTATKNTIVANTNDETKMTSISLTAML